MNRRGGFIRRAWLIWIRVLLRWFPVAFRREMSADLAEHYAANAPGTTGQLVRRAAGAAVDLTRAGLGARLDELRTARPRSSLVNGLGADARHGIRVLIRQRTYSATVVLTLALAAGLATAVFGIFDATLVRPLPFPEEHRLLSIGSLWTGVEHSAVSIPEYLDYRARARSLESIAAYRNVSVNFAEGRTGPERVRGAAVTKSFFDVLGVQPALGRVFTDLEDRPRGEPVALLAHGLWQRRFGGDPSIIGRPVRIDDQPVTIVGIMPPEFHFPAADTQVWLPLRVNEADPGGRGAHTRRAIARMRPDATFTAARDELAAIGRQFARDYPESYPDGSGWGVSVKPLREWLVGDVSDPLRLLLAAALFVLLIAAANTSGLMVARASQRRAEFAARAALGASRVRLVRQVVIEGTVAAVVGAVLGLPLAELLLRSLHVGLPPSVTTPDVLALDARVLVFAFGITTCAAAAAAAYAAIHASGVSAADTLRAGARITAGRGMRRLRASLVVGELALALLLLIGAGLAFRSVASLMDVDPGFSAAHVTTARLSLPSARYPTGLEAVTFYERLIESLEASPGVAHAGAVSILPLSGSEEDVNFGVEGYVPPTPGQAPNSQARFVAGNYFRALGIPLVRGRLFAARDRTDAPFVALVSQALARKYWPGLDPIGRRLKLWSLDDDGPWRTVVGVVGDVHHSGLGEGAPPILYLPVTQFPQRTLTVVVRPDRAQPLQRLIENHVRVLDPAQPVFDVRTMEDWIERSTAQPRFSLLMLTIFAGAALTLAALGVYGVVAFTVASHTRELGIRVALGAEPRRLMGFMIARGLLLALVGLSLGFVGAVMATGYLSTIFYGIEPIEPLVYGGAAAVLGLVALTACAIPARRILRLDPTAALRAE